MSGVARFVGRHLYRAFVQQLVFSTSGRFFVAFGIWHVIVGALILLDPAAVGATNLAALDEIPPRILGGAFVITGLFGIFGAGCSIWLLLPQQFLLAMGAGGPVLAMMNEQYADGVVRPRAFIMADQVQWPLFAVVHFLAMIGTFRRRASWRP